MEDVMKEKADLIAAGCCFRRKPARNRGAAGKAKGRDPIPLKSRKV